MDSFNPHEGHIFRKNSSKGRICVYVYQKEEWEVRNYTRTLLFTSKRRSGKYGIIAARCYSPATVAFIRGGAVG